MFEGNVMAKKRRKDREKEAEEEYEFRPPEFKEEEFLRKEMSDTKTVIYTVLYAGVLAVVAWAMTLASRDLVGPAFLVIVAGVFSLRWVYPALGVDTKAFQKKNWLGNIATFFFTCLAIWILLLNQPFADFSNPTITNVTVWVEKPGNITAIDYKVIKDDTFAWVARYNATVAGIIHTNSSYIVNITARVADNSGVKSVSINWNGTVYPMTSEGKHIYGYKILGSQIKTSALSFTIYAVDKANNQAMLAPNGSISVTSP